MKKGDILRRLFSALCALVIVFTCFPAAAFAATGNQLTATISRSTIAQGSSGYCYVYVDSLEDLASLNLAVYFDPAKVRVTNAYNSVSCTLYDSAIQSDHVQYTYLFDGEGAASQTRLFWFSYEILSDAPVGDTYFDIVVTDAHDTALNEVAISGSRRKFTIVEAAVNKTCSMWDSGAVQTSVKEEFEISYYLSPSEVASGSVVIQYDQELFELVGVTNGAFLDGKTVNVNTALTGAVYLSFVGTGYSYSNDFVKLRFRTASNTAVTSQIKVTVSDLYDLERNSISCSGYTSTITVAHDPTYTEDAPTMALTPIYSPETGKITATITLDKDSRLGAGDFVLKFDPTVLTYVSCTKGFTPSFFNINDKKVAEGELKFSIISLADITDTQTVLTVTFDTAVSCEDYTTELELTGSGLADSMTNGILLNFVASPAVVTTNGHDFSVSQHDSYNHWQKCSRCDEIDGSEAHHGGTVTCTERGVCIDCGTAYGSTLGHDFSVTKYDGEYHWKKCSRCEVIDGKEAHYGGTATCTEQKICEDCRASYGNTLGHDFSVDKHDADYHWQKCSRCDETDGSEAHHGGTATCTEQKICEDCRASYGNTLGHDFSVGKHDADYHWQKCSRCEEIDGKEAHHGGTATCTEQKVCEDCGTSYGDILGHDFSVDNHDADYHWQKCSRCEEFDSKEAHYGGTATCTEKNICEGCGTAYGTVDSNYHAYSSTLTQGETTHYYLCSRCGDKKNEEAHNYQNYQPNGNGSHTGTCICGKTNTALCTGDDASATCQKRAVCQICGSDYGSLGNHDFDLSAWGYRDTTGHAHNCKTEDCQQHDAVTGHHSSGEATEDVAETCLDCGYIINPATGHIRHTPSDAWSSNSDSHWKECVGCDTQEFEKGSHIYDNACDAVCNTCNYVRSIAHSYALESSTTEHWQACEVCGAEKPNSRVPHSGGLATCQEKAQCVFCNAKYGEKDTDNHTGTTYHYESNSDGTHKKIYDCCNNVAEQAEACAGGTATCTTKKICSCCNSLYGDVLGHDFSVDKHDEGYHWKKCTRCDEVDGKAAHFGGTATCTELAICQGCNASYGKYSDHDFSVAKCDADYHWQKCSRCDATDDKEAHYGGTATCTEKKACTDCGVRYGDVLSHSYEDAVTPPTESQKGYTTHTCKHCGHSYVDAYTDPVGPSCITSSMFTIQGQYLQKVTSGTTVKQLLEGLNEGSYCKVYKNTAEVADNTLVGTGMTVKLIVAGKIVQELTIIVTGDINGDGKITATDMLSVKAHLLGKSILAGSAAQAADVSGDGKITATDFLQIKAYLLGKSQIKPH